MEKLPASVSGIDGTFIRRVRQLVSEGGELAAIHSNLTERLLEFGVKFRDLWDYAKKLDAGDHGKHGEYLRRELVELIGGKSKTIQSNWRTIGEAAPKLLPYKDSLPPTRETLMEVAKAAMKGKPIERWIEQKKLNGQSSVREVRALTRPKKVRPKKAKNRSAAADAQRYVTVTVTLNTNYGEAAKLFLDLLKSRQVIRYKSDKGFDEALREELREAYDTLKTKAA